MINEDNVGNLSTKNIPYDIRLRAGFRMINAREDDNVFPERYRDEKTQV